MEPMEGAARVVKPQEVLESLMNDGTFDALRGKVTAQLKSNEELKRFTQSLVENSMSLNTPGAENKSRRELFDSLRRELEGPVLDKASKAAWELILSRENLGKEIADAVESTYGKLSTQAEAPPPEARAPSQEPHHQQNAGEYNTTEKSTPSHERGGVDPKANGSASGYYSQNGRENAGGSYSGKRDREQMERSRFDRESSRDREVSESWRDHGEKSRNRDRDLYERRDAAREREWGRYDRGDEFAQGGRDHRESRDYFDNRRMPQRS